MLTIDGSFGEGGGQVLRTSLAMSLATGRAFRIIAIRARRPKPGLLRQHLTAVQAAADVGQAQVAGASLGSQEITFVPAGVRPGEYRFAVGTAGSTTLVLQTVLAPLLTATGPSLLILEGGTHNPFAPPFDFLDRVFLPIINRLGPKVAATLERPGFYPCGGGRFSVTITPSRSLSSLELRQRGEIIAQTATARVAGLPRHIAERDLCVLSARLGLDPTRLQIEELPARFGPGNVVMVEVVSQHVTELFAGFGERGVPAETVAERVARAVQTYLQAGVPVGEHLADQLLVPLALAGAGSFHTLPPSRHTTTNIEVIKRFLDISIAAEAHGEPAWSVRVGSAASDPSRRE